MKKPDYLISTPENVDLHIELAGMGSRIWAAFVDSMLSGLMILLVMLIATAVSVQIIEKLELPRDTKTMIHYYVLAITLLLIFCISLGYFICFEGLWQGQTPGKKLVQIRVMEANGQPVSWASVWIRNLLRLIDTNMAMLGLVFMLFDKHERRLGDMAAGTLVIRERPAELSARNLKIAATEVPPAFVDAGQISPDEYHLLVTFLRRRHSMLPESRASVARDMEDYFRIKLNYQTASSTSEDFLETLYLAYAARADMEHI